MLEIMLKKELGALKIDADININGVGITVIFGSSGAGKSSIINMIAGLLKPDDSKIIISGRDITKVPIHKRKIGYVFQEGRLFPHKNVKDNLLYGSKRHHEGGVCETLEYVVELLGVGELLERFPAKLSGGEKQRVAIGRALLSSPEILLMDEPLASLDNERKSELVSYIGKIPERFKIPILYVTHSLDELKALADNVIAINNGTTTFYNSVEEFLDKKFV